MQFELKHIINVIIIFQLVSFSIFLFTQKKNNSVSNQILAVFLLSIAVIFVGDVFDHFKEYIYHHFPHFFYIDFPFPYLYPPLLFLYTKSLATRGCKLSKKHLIHFMPFVLAFVLILLKYHIYSADTKRVILSSGPRYDPVFGSGEGDIYSILFYGQFFSYAIGSLIVLRHYQSAVKRYFASLERINLSWLEFVIWGLVLWNFLRGVNQLHWIVSGIHSTAVFVVTKMIMLILASIVFFKGLRQPEILLGLNGNYSKKKYEKSLLPEPERERYLQKLLKYMESKKPYLDPAINLHMLAEHISISPHHLSQVLNESLRQNFFDFVNSYRIKESQHLLSQPANKKVTVLEILYKAGFNSKSVFNTAFKKHTGMTPTEFRKSQAKQ